MAAVVSSLAAFLIGYGVPGIPGVGGGQGLVARDRSGAEHELGAGECECPNSAVWGQARQAAGLEVATTLGRALAPRQAQSSAALTAKAASDARSCDLDFTAAAAEGVLCKQPPPRVHARSALRPRRPRNKSGSGDHAIRRVRFDLSKKTVHEVTPYAEVYGVHPRDFDFGNHNPRPGASRRLRAAPTDAWRFVDPSGGAGGDEDSEDEEELVRAKYRILGLRRAPRHLWFSACVLCFLLRMFGSEVFSEMLPEMQQLKVAKVA